MCQPHTVLCRYAVDSVVWRTDCLHSVANRTCVLVDDEGMVGSSPDWVSETCVSLLLNELLGWSG